MNRLILPALQFYPTYRTHSLGLPFQESPVIEYPNDSSASLSCLQYRSQVPSHRISGLLACLPVSHQRFPAHLIRKSDCTLAVSSSKSLPLEISASEATHGSITTSLCLQTYWARRKRRSQCFGQLFELHDRRAPRRAFRLCAPPVRSSIPAVASSPHS